jgi:hypothetical protein
VETVRTLVDALGHWASRLMPDPDRADGWTETCHT